MLRRNPFGVCNGFIRSYLDSKISESDRSAASRKPHLVLDFPIVSLRSSIQETVSLSSSDSKVTHLESTTNSDLVMNMFKKCGLNDSQISEIVSNVPNILRVDASKTLEPKLRVFLELGLSGSDLVKMIKKNPEIFGYGLHTRIKPGLDFLRELLGSDEMVVKAINNSRWLTVSNNTRSRISSNLLLLRSYGLSDERIAKFVVNNPNRLTVKSKWLEERLHYVEEKLGIPRSSGNFIHGVSVTLWYTDSELEEKMQVFRRFGWSDSEVLSLFRAQPYCLNKSEANICDKLSFFMKELGYTPSYLTVYHAFFTLSLEKRVKPRYNILKILKEKNLVNEKLSLMSVSTYPELKFLEFLQSFKSDVPRLCESYMSSIKSKSNPEKI